MPTADPRGCPVCDQEQATGISDPAINVRCWSCDGTFHVHRSRFEDLDVTGEYACPCPDCGAYSAWAIEQLIALVLPRLSRN